MTEAKTVWDRMATVVEEIAAGWDDCTYDAPGVGEIDIGASIRASGTQLLSLASCATADIAPSLNETRQRLNTMRNLVNGLRQSIDKCELLHHIGWVEKDIADGVLSAFPDAWMREDGTDVMRADEKVAWIESGNRDRVALYTVPLYAKKDPEDVPGTWVTREDANG